MNHQTAGRALTILLVLVLLLGGCARQPGDGEAAAPDEMPEETISSAREPGHTAPESAAGESAAPSVSSGAASAAAPAEERAEESRAEPPPIPAADPLPGSLAEDDTPATQQSIALPDLEGEEEQSPLAALLATPMSSAALVEQELVRLINNERQQNGLEALGVEESMQFAARIRAEEVLASMSHTRPDGSAYHTAFEEAGFRYSGKWHGENLAMLVQPDAEYDEAEIARLLFAEWTGSPGHYQNMTGEHFHQTGVGVYILREDGRMTVGAAQMFAGF